MKRFISCSALAVLVTLAVFVALPAHAGPPDVTGLERAIAATDAHTDVLMSVQGVVGTAVGVDAAGNPVVKILTDSPGVAGLPQTLDGVRVDIQVTGKLFAIHHRTGHGGGPGGGGGGSPGGGEDIDPTARFDRPVPIGVSTGNTGECSSGTIGARVTDGIEVYALSNNHVYARENAAPLGSEILQPGRFDTNCASSAADIIGTLADFVPMDFSGAANAVDAALALSSTSDLGNATPSDGYGTPSSSIAQETLGLAVQKYGRTTGHTRGTITGINATVNVGYSSGTALFVNQIIVEGNKPVLKSGDSGSLLVTDPGKSPVGLLFAGNRSGKLGIANDIDNVLAAFVVTIDGD